MDAWSLGHVWGHPVYDNVTLPELAPPVMVLAEQLQQLVEELAPQELREVGAALGIDHLVVVVALEMVEKNSNPSPMRVRSMAEAGLEERSEEDRVGDLVDVLLLGAGALARAAARCGGAGAGAGVGGHRPGRADRPAVRAGRAARSPAVAERRCRSRLHHHSRSRYRGAGVGQDRAGAVRGAAAVALGRGARAGAVALVGRVDRPGRRPAVVPGRAASVAAARWNAARVVQALLADPERAINAHNG